MHTEFGDQMFEVHDLLLSGKRVECAREVKQSVDVLETEETLKGDGFVDGQVGQKSMHMDPLGQVDHMEDGVVFDDVSPALNVKDDPLRVRAGSVVKPT